jgi:hypothetical protein
MSEGYAIGRIKELGVSLSERRKDGGRVRRCHRNWTNRPRPMRSESIPDPSGSPTILLESPSWRKLFFGSMPDYPQDIFGQFHRFFDTDAAMA